MPLQTIIDTDVAFDDWMAIGYLLHSSRVDVCALTAAATGEAHAGPGVQTLLQLLALSDHPAIPVAAGRRKPLTGNQAFPLVLRLVMDFRLGLRLPKARQKPSKETALQVLIQQLHASIAPTTIVALGPLTNLAELLLAEPALHKKIADIFIMGGALNVAGNIREVNAHIDNPYAEWNIFVDPYAFDVLLRSGVPITMVPLDVTNQHQLTPAFIERLGQYQDTPTARFIYRALRRLAGLIGSRPYYFWDPLTAVVAAAPEIATFRNQRIHVVREAGTNYGRTVADEQGFPVRVCIAVDAAAFEEAFISTINRRFANPATNP
jgi:inosine-uridine nucleoside N-ribohydrolase